MASSANGNVKITTEIETAGLQESLNRLESIFNSFANNLKESARKTGDDVAKNLSGAEKATKVFDNLAKSGEKVTKTFKVVGTAAVGLASSFIGIVKGAISTADRVDELSKRLGVSAQSFSRLDYVASQSGTSVEAFGTAMRMIAQNINTGSDAYERLGVSVKDANGQLKTQDQILLETIKALQQMPAGTQKSALALKALGRQSMQLNEILNMTSDEFEALMKRSDELGLTLDESITMPAQKIADKFTDLHKTFKMALVNAVAPMIPALEKITDRFIEMLQPGGELAEAFKNIAEAGLAVVENVLPKLITGLAWVVKNGPAIIGVFTAIKVAIQALTGNWIGAIATGLLGTTGAVVLAQAYKTKDSIDAVTESVKDLGTEVKRQTASGGAIVDITEQENEAFEKWTQTLDIAEKQLKQFVASKSTLEKGFDVSSLTDADLGKYNKLKANVAEAKAVLQTLQNAVADTKDEISKTDAFTKLSDALKVAESDLKDFISAHSDLAKGFDAGGLTEQEIEQFDVLKTKVKQLKDALNSMNDALADTKDEFDETDVFARWTDAVEKANEALKEFIATKAQEYGTFDVDKLTDEERQHFERLRETVRGAQAELQKLQDATDTTARETESNLANVANVIAEAWANVGSAFGNGIESVVETIAQGSHDMSTVMNGLSQTMADSLSAIGDALIQAGIAKMVADQLAEINPAYAIAMGMAIKVAAGAIKGMIARMGKAGSFANGGIVGGASFSGDRMTANVNSGEMIINRKQQAALWDFIRNGSNGGGNAPNIEIINNAGVNIQTESEPNNNALRVIVNQQIERFLGSPRGGRVMLNTFGTRQLGRR